ncbi:hypothetical protein Tco_0671023 [Tanacetum coccineum]
MAALRYRDEHNKVGYLQKPKGSDDYHQVLNFLSASHIRFALTHNPIIFDSLVKQFWSTATFKSPELGPPAILATIDETPYTITEDSSGSWDQFGSPLAVALICLSDGRKFNWSSYIFKGMLNFEGQPMPLLAVMLSQAQAGKGVGMVKVQTQTLLCFSRAHKTDDEPFTSTNVEDEPLGVYTFVQKVNSLETELKAHKKLFKDVVGKLVKKVKVMEVKLKTKKRKVVVSDSDQEEGGEQAVDLDALIALANAAVTVDSNIPPGGASNNPAASSHIPTDVPTGGDFAPAHSTSPSRDPFKRKGVAKPSSPVSERTKKQLADERLSEIEAARLEALERERSEKEKAKIARQDAIYAKQLEQEEEMSASQRETRQAEVLSSPKHYSDADWIDIMAQVHANAGLSSELLGADVNDDNFAERMVALINQRKRAFAA